VEFAHRLQKAMMDKGFTGADLARRATGFMPGGSKGRDAKIGRDQISHYIRGVSIPRAPQLKAMARALGVTPESLLPQLPKAADRAPAAEFRQLDDGNIWVRINQALPWSIAIQIMGLVNPDANKPTD
jgi:transcriptional regulator with XRE-family HTH domain